MKKTITYKEIKDKVLDIINNGGGGGGKSKLSELNDVTITSASDGQVLKYNGSKWVNGTAGGVEIKSKSWTGDGGNTTTIVLDEGTKMVLAMTGIGGDNHPVQLTNCLPLAEGVHCLDVAWTHSDYSGIGGRLQCKGTYDESTHTLVLSGGNDAGIRFNYLNTTNTIYYI